MPQCSPSAMPSVKASWSATAFSPRRRLKKKMDSGSGSGSPPPRLRATVGSLLDSDGQVIGVIVGKSENENLNYALPIARVLDAPDHAARFDAREMVTLPFIHGEVTNAYVDQFALPLQWQEFADAYQHLKAHHDDEGRERFLKAYASKLFPKGPGSEALLYSSDPRGYRPTMIAERSDGSWGADSVEYSSADLPDDGSVQYRMETAQCF